MKRKKDKKINKDTFQDIEIDINESLDNARVINLYGFNSIERLDALIKFIKKVIGKKGDSVVFIDALNVTKKEDIEKRIGRELTEYHQVTSADDQILLLEKLYMQALQVKKYDVIAIYDFSSPFTKYYKKIGQYWERDNMIENQINTLNDLANYVGVIICTNEAHKSALYPSNEHLAESWGNTKLKYLFDKQFFVRGDIITTNPAM